MTTERIRLLPLWLRLWHWTSAMLLLTLAASGISLHFATPNSLLIPFRVAREIHTIAGLIQAASYVFFLSANAASGNWRQYLSLRDGFACRAMVQARYYLWDIFQGKPQPYPATPDIKFNALQQLIYALIMYLAMPILVVSGVLFLFPDSAPDHVMGVDGLLPLAMTHYMTAYCVFMFTLGHIYLATTGKTPTSLIRTMITGWKE
ncbi:MAG: cytochrome b/b6 domain-containing protein [Rhodospirillaceae bacterium]|nr:cytochrome b/b6 domain-containing protein [Rhodospirillales bacterium]